MILLPEKVRASTPALLKQLSGKDNAAAKLAFEQIIETTQPTMGRVFTAYVKGDVIVATMLITSFYRRLWDHRSEFAETKDHIGLLYRMARREFERFRIGQLSIRQGDSTILVPDETKTKQTISRIVRSRPREQRGIFSEIFKSQMTKEQYALDKGLPVEEMYKSCEIAMELIRDQLYGASPINDSPLPPCT